MKVVVLPRCFSAHKFLSVVNITPNGEREGAGLLLPFDQGEWDDVIDKQEFAALADSKEIYKLWNCDLRDQRKTDILRS